MRLYNVTAELGGDPRPRSSSDADSEAVERRVQAYVWDQLHGSLHASEHHDDGLAITISVEASGPGFAASDAVALLRAYAPGLVVDAVEAMEATEFDRRNGL